MRRSKYNSKRINIRNKVQKSYPFQEQKARPHCAVVCTSAAKKKPFEIGIDNVSNK